MTNTDRPMRGPLFYRLFGLTIATEIALPELREVAPAKADVTIALAPVPPVAGPGRDRLQRDGDGAVLDVPKVGRFAIRHGNSIAVDPLADAGAARVRLFLLGSAIGALLHQRGMLPLHANAIALDKRAIAFAGNSGAGKSTLAAAFHDHGSRLLSDDICVVTPREAGGFDAQPGIPRVRLWRDALERSGRIASDHDAAYAGADKFVVRIEDGHADAAIPLAAIYILDDKRKSAPELAIEPLSGAEAAHALVTNVYRHRYAAITGDPAAMLAQGARLARHVRVFRLRRPWDPAQIGSIVARIEAHLAEIGA